MSKKLNDKIREILAEAAYEDLGPAVVTPWTTQGPNAAGPVKPAHAPVATNPVTGAKSLSSDNPAVAGSGEAGPAAPPAAPAPEKKEEGEKEEEKCEECGESPCECDDKEEKEDDLEEAFSEMLTRLREEEEEEEDKEAEPAPAAAPAAGAGPAAVNPVPPVPPGQPEGLKLGNKPELEECEDEDEVQVKEVCEEEEGEKEEPKAKEKKKEGEEEPEDEKPKEVDIKSDENAMFAGQNLPEAFKAKASAIFRSTVARAVKEERKRLTKKYTRQLTEALSILKGKASKKQQVYEAKLTEQVDMYLNYVVENWMTENKLAVERGIRAELTEDFIRGLKKLFVEHYIEVPEDKVDVLKSLESQVTKLETKLNEQVQVNAKQRQTISGLKKETVLREVGTGLTDTQVEKLRSLSEGVEYTNRKEFTKRLSDLRESYFAKKATKPATERVSITESVVAEQEEPTSAVDLYSRAISRSKGR